MEDADVCFVKQVQGATVTLNGVSIPIRMLELANQKRMRRMRKLKKARLRALKQSKQSQPVEPKEEEPPKIELVWGRCCSDTGADDCKQFQPRAEGDGDICTCGHPRSDHLCLRVAPKTK